MGKLIGTTAALALVFATFAGCQKQSQTMTGPTIPCGGTCDDDDGGGGGETIVVQGAPGPQGAPGAPGQPGQPGSPGVTNPHPPPVRECQPPKNHGQGHDKNHDGCEDHGGH